LNINTLEYKIDIRFIKFATSLYIVYNNAYKCIYFTNVVENSTPQFFIEVILLNTMKQDTIQISKKEYTKLKQEAKLNRELLIKLVKGLGNIKAGRIKLFEDLKI